MQPELAKYMDSRQLNTWIRLYLANHELPIYSSDRSQFNFLKNSLSFQGFTKIRKSKNSTKAIGTLNGIRYFGISILNVKEAKDQSEIPGVLYHYESKKVLS